jgi:IS30 family transposase
MHHVVIDLIGGNLVNSKGGLYILTVVDVHSRLIWLGHLPDQIAPVVAAALLNISRDFEPSMCTGYDNGPEFQNDLAAAVA